jgi:oxygen-independent coproporphyrinogen-3 oxidase
MPGVYISWPFCSQKCTFCNFASGVYKDDLKERYLQALLREIRQHPWTFDPNTLYFGGGTPSLLQPHELEAILSTLPVRSWEEFTLEAAPGTISAEQIQSWRRAGLNRISLGTQSFVVEELRRTGRRHTPEIVREELSFLREAGIENINLDLIAGLPGQTWDSWKISLDWVIDLDVPHVSVYMLEVDDDSRLGLEILQKGSRYGANRVPGEDKVTDFYQYAVERLQAAGIVRYEISNFSRVGFQSLHNRKYWELSPYVGFGLEAHSFDDRFRWGNTADLNGYLAQIESGRNRPDRSEAGLREERYILGLRLDEGIELLPQDESLYRHEVEEMILQGLLTLNEGVLRLTAKGILVSNEVFERFLPAEIHAPTSSRD